MTNAVHPIAAVWTLTASSNPLLTSLQLVRHPDETTIQRTREIALTAAQLKYTVPQLDFLQSTTVKVVEGETGRGIIDHYVYLVDSALAIGSDVPAAAMVVSELPEHMRTTKIALETAMNMQEDMARDWGIGLQWSRIDDPVFGVMVEMGINNRQATNMFPTANYVLAEKPNTLGVSRFALFEGKLVEWSIIVPTPAGMTDDGLTEFVSFNMNAFMRGLSPA